MQEKVKSYLAALDAQQREIAEALRALILEAAPEATEAFKWAQPVYELGGPMCWIKAHKAHVTLGFWRGLQLPSAEGRIEGSGDKMGHLKLRTTADIDKRGILQLVREAVQLNRTHGDPTRRR